MSNTPGMSGSPTRATPAPPVPPAPPVRSNGSNGNGNTFRIEPDGETCVLQLGDIEYHNRWESWPELRPGDPVTVRQARRRRGTSFTFRAFARNARTGAEWVEVFGGSSGRRVRRAFPCGRVSPLTRGRQHSPRVNPHAVRANADHGGRTASKVDGT